MNLTALKNRLKQIIGLGGILGIIIIIAGFITASSLKTSLTKKVTTIKSNNEIVQSRARVFERHDELSKEAKQAAIFESSLQNILASKDDILSFSRDIEAIAKTSQVEVVPTFSGDETIKGRFGSAGITLTVDGGYFDIVSFLAKLENSRFLVKLNSLDLAEKTDKNGFRLFTRGQVIYRQP